MRGYLIIILSLAVFILIIGLGASSDGTMPQNSEVIIPESKAYVNDYAEILSPDFEAKMESDLSNISSEIAVLTVKSMGGLSIEEFAIKVGDAWKVGDAEKDDGVILIVSTGERKVRIEVGYGAESKINDAKAGRILDESVVPHFKNNDWENGILSGVESIKSALKE